MLWDGSDLIRAYPGSLLLQDYEADFARRINRV